MQHTDKMRAEFEAWRLAKFCGGVERLKKCSNAHDVYYYTAEQEAWTAWKESRAALVVELPMATDDDLVELLEECRAAIEAAGVTVRG
jgi:hypothetical protein